MSEKLKVVVDNAKGEYVLVLPRKDKKQVGFIATDRLSRPVEGLFDASRFKTVMNAVDVLKTVKQTVLKSPYYNNWSEYDVERMFVGKFPPFIELGIINYNSLEYRQIVAAQIKAKLSTDELDMLERFPELLEYDPEDDDTF